MQPPPCFCLTQQSKNLGLGAQDEKTFEPQILLSCTFKVLWINGEMGTVLPLEYFGSWLLIQSFIHTFVLPFIFLNNILHVNVRILCAYG